MKNIIYPRLFTLAILLLFTLVNNAKAQKSIVDSLLSARKDSLLRINPDSVSKPKFVLIDTVRYRFIGDGNFTRGNVNRTLMVLRAEALFSGPVISIATNPRFTYGKQNGVLAERDSYIDLFVDVFKKRRTYVFGLGVLETSNLRRIILREMIGAGIGFRVLHNKNNDLLLTNAVLYESTNFREIPTVSIARNSFRIKGKHAVLQDKIRFNHITFIQPAITGGPNWRWNTILSIELPINKWVTVRTSFENSFESVVEQTRKRNDSRVTFGISIGNK